MLCFHDVRPGSGWAPGLHFTLSSLEDLQPGPSPASDQLVTGGGEKSPSRTCDHTRDCTHTAHATPGRCTPPLQPLGEAPEWPLGSWPRPGGRGRREQGSSLEATAGMACVAVSRYASLRGAHVLPGQTRSALLHRRPGDEKGARERTTEAADTEGWHFPVRVRFRCSQGHFLVSTGRHRKARLGMVCAHAGRGTYLGARLAGLDPAGESSPSPGFAVFSRFICCRIEFNSLITFAFGPERIGLLTSEMSPHSLEVLGWITFVVPGWAPPGGGGRAGRGITKLSTSSSSSASW